jgi:hypothetical protein
MDINNEKIMDDNLELNAFMLLYVNDRSDNMHMIDDYHRFGNTITL